MAADINVTADISNAIENFSRLLNLTDKQEEQFRNTAQATIKYDEALKKTVTTVNGSVSAFQKLSGSVETAKAALVGNTDVISAKLVDLNEKMLEAAKSASTFEIAVKRVTGTLVNLALYRGFNEIAHGISDAVTQAQAFQTKIAQIQAVSQNTGSTTASLTKSIQTVSNALGVDFKDAADSAKQAVQSGLASGNEIPKYIETVGNLAKVTGESMKDAGASLNVFLNSFNHTALDAEASAAKLFKTASLGKANFGDLARSIGQATEQAKLLGVSEDELLALFAVLSKELGAGRAGQALSSFFASIIKPSKELKTAFQGLDPTTNLQGFAGIIKSLDTAKASGFNIQDLIGGSRGLKVFEGQKQAAEDYAKALNEIKNAQGSFDVAKGIIGGTDADKLKQFNEIAKNLAVESIGQKFTALTASIAGSATQLGVFLDSATILGAKVSDISDNFGKLALAVGAGAVAFRGFAASATVAQGALGFLGAAAASYLASKELLKLGFNVSEGAGEGLSNLTQASREQAASTQNENLSSQQKLVASIQAGWDEVGKKINGPVNAGIVDVNRRLKDLVESAKSVDQNLSEAFSGALNPGKDKLASIRQEIEAIQNSLKAAPERRIARDETANRATTGLLESFADPRQKLQLLANEQQDDAKKIQQLVAAGDEKSLERARQLADRNVQNAIKAGQIQLDYQRKAEEFRLKNDPTAASQAPRDEFGNTIIYVDQARVLAQINQAKAEANRLDELGIQLEKQRLAALQKQEQAQQQKNKADQDAYKNFLELSPVDKEGNIKKEFQTDSGKFDSEKFERARSSAEEGVRGVISKGDVYSSAPLIDAIVKKNQSVAQTTDALKSRETLQGQAASNAKTIEDQKGIAQLSQTKQEQSVKEANEGISKLILFGKGISDALKQEGASTTSILNFGRGTDAGRNAQTTANRIDQQVGTLSSLQSQLSNAKTPEERQAILAKVGGLLNGNEGFLKNTSSGEGQLPGGSGLNAANTRIPGNNSGLTFGQANNVRDKGVEQVNEAVQLQAQSKQALTASTEALARYSIIVGDFSSQTDKYTKAFANLGKSAQDTAQALQLAQSIIQKSLASQPTTPPSVTYDPNGPFIQPQDRFFGGPLYRAYGGPIGSDAIPMYGSAGEMVMNAASTSRYYTQLMGANTQSRIPQRFETGGIVNQTNNINIQGENNAEATGYKIDMMLRRAKRLGTIK